MFRNDPPRRTILYYPTINIPTHSWLQQAVLYWDVVQSIAPLDREGNPIKVISQDIRYLLGEEEFQPIDPRIFTDQTPLAKQRRQLNDEFIRVVESEQFQSKLPSVELRRYDSTVHVDKVNDELQQYLFDHQLARVKRSRLRGEWIHFERRTAMLYMALLAKYIGQLIHSPIGTDWMGYHDFVFMPIANEEAAQCIQTRFVHWLPVPDEHVLVQEIVAFKRQRRDELLHFREEIDNFHRQLRNCESMEQVQQEVIAFQESVERGLNDLTAALQDAGLETKMGTLRTLIDLNRPAILAALGVATIETIGGAGHPGLGTGITLIAAGAIQLGSYLIGRRNLENATLRGSPFSYLYRGQKEYIFPGRV